MTPRTARPIQEFARNCASLSLKNCLPPSTKARRVISRELQFDPTISPIKNLDHDYFFGLPHFHEGAGCPIMLTVYVRPWLRTSCPACEPNCKACLPSHPVRHIQ